jgi:hypothetical protein
MLSTKKNDVSSTNSDFDHHYGNWKLVATFLLPKNFNFKSFQPKTPY